MTDTTSLYRHFNATGDLLYVGISINAFERYKQHASEKEWFDDVSNMTIERFDTRQCALEAEMSAIKNENPKYNIVGTPLANVRRKKPSVKIAEKKPARKRYSKEIEWQVAGTIQHSKEEIDSIVNSFWRMQEYIHHNRELKVKHFVEGQTFYLQERGGIYSRSCELLTITAVEEQFLVVKYLDGREEALMIHRPILNNLYFIDEDYYKLTPEEEKEYEGIDIKKSMEICGYDPRHFRNVIGGALSATRVVAFCKDCNSQHEVFLSKYYKRDTPHFVGDVRTPCDWHRKY